MYDLDINIVETDVLIIGSGIAGLRAALEVSRTGKKCLVVSKSVFGKTNNTYLSGGYFAFATDHYDMETHKKRTLQTGRSINDESLVNLFVRESPALIMELQKMGMPYSLQKTGLTTRSRFLVGGPEIFQTLTKACRNEYISLLENVIITDLLVNDGECFGALGFQKFTGENLAIKSNAVVLATGGAGAIYLQNDNAPGIIGDGYALGMKAGLELIDMEFVQFYPLIMGGGKKARLLIPALFADMGPIKNRLGEDLKEKYDLKEKPLAIVGRDRLSRALFSEIALGNDVNGSLLLDVRGSNIDNKLKFSDNLKKLLEKKLAYNSKPIPIMPACHHTMGGLMINMSCETQIKRLFAAGEVVGGVHGANRMGGNALSEALVFGAIAGRGAADTWSSLTKSDLINLIHNTSNELYKVINVASTMEYRAPQLRKELAQIMWDKIGIIRNEVLLTEGLHSIDRIINTLNEEQVSGIHQIRKLIECKFAAYSARAIAVSALKRTESRGAHYREDFVDEKEDWLRHIHVDRCNDLPQIVRISSILEK